MEDRAAVLRQMRICRFCLTEIEPLTNIYAKDKNIITPLSLQIMSCVALEVFANDGMPQLICESCRTQTRQSYNFKTLCKRSDDALKLYIATGILKRGDDEIMMSKSLKRPASDQQIERPDKKLHIASTNAVKNEASSQEITENSKEISKEKEKKVDVTSQNIEIILPGLEITEESQETEIHSEIQEANQKNVIESEKEGSPIEEITSFDDTQTGRTAHNIVIHARITEDGEIIQQSEEVYSDVQILSDPSMEEMIFEDFAEKEPAPPTIAPIKSHCFPCTSCERTFPLQQLLDIHTRQHTRERKHSCSVCTRRFFSKHDLSKHMQLHIGSKPFTCVVCEKTFSRATLLHRHEKVHNSAPRYLCTYCEKTYLSSEDLDRHMKTHKKNRPFKCGECDKRFAFKQGLDRHLITHNENSHKCNYCDERFNTSSKLQRHIQTHAGTRPYPCKYCPQTFLLSHHLTRHLKNHKQSRVEESGEFKCDVCSMSFQKKFALINHTVIHSMVNLKCVICNKVFKNAETVKDHIKTHLSGLPFLCYKCEYSFETEDELIAHEQKHFDSENEDEESSQTIPDNITSESIPRRSQRDRKVKTFTDFLKDEDFSEIEEEVEESDEEFNAGSQKNSPIQPIIRNESIKVYKGIKTKTIPLQIKQEEIETVTEPKKTAEKNETEVEVPNEPLQEVNSQKQELQKSPKTLTKITTLDHLGITKSALDALTEKSGFVEMKVGQKVIRVQKLMMTKADVQAMAEQGKLELKGSKVVVKNAGGFLNLNKLNLSKGIPLTVSDDINKITTLTKVNQLSAEEFKDTHLQKSSVRTYVKKICKKEEDTVENESENTEKNTSLSENIANIDLKENDEQVKMALKTNTYE